MFVFKYFIWNSFIRKYTSLQMHINTFLFMDLETTGFPWLENNKTKITEISFIAVNRDHLKSGIIPRVLQKLTLCLQPFKMISPGSSEVTGLYNDLLENQKLFSAQTTDLINNFIDHLDGNVCMVAHNGNGFDYPILQAHLHATGKSLRENVMCLDSLLAFREIIPKSLLNDADNLQQIVNETTPAKQPKIHAERDVPDSSKARRRLPFSQEPRVSYKLPDIYKELFKVRSVDAHNAEGDVFTLLKCCGQMNKAFIKYADENAVLFNTIPRMEPGVPLNARK